MDMGDDSSKRQPGAGADTTPHQPPAHHDDVNISEEVKKTGIWHHLNSQPTLSVSAQAATPPVSTDVSKPRHRSGCCGRLSTISSVWLYLSPVACTHTTVSLSQLVQYLTDFDRNWYPVSWIN